MDSYNQILISLKKLEFKPIYFLTGDEPYFIDNIANLVKNKSIMDSDRDFNQNIFYGKDTSVEEIISACKQYPMMSNKRLVLVREAQELSKSIHKFENYFDNPSKTTILVICFKYKKIDKRKKFFKSLSKNGIFFDGKKLYQNQIPSWIQSHANNNGLKIDFKAASLMSENTGSDLSKIDSNLKKLLLAVGHSKTITSDDIEIYIGVSKEFNNFELRNAIGDGNKLKAFKIARYFGKNSKKNPVILTISSLYDFFLQILKYHSLTSKNPQFISNELGIHPYFVKDLEKASKRYPIKSITPILRIITQSDLALKGVNSVTLTEHEILKQLLIKII